MEKRIDFQYATLDDERSIAPAPEAGRGSAIPYRVPCTVCRHEIPVDEALVPEATDYVVHFCGLDCYQLWLNQPDRR